MLYLTTFSIWSRSVSVFHVSLSIIIFTISRSLLAVLSQYSWKRVVRRKKNIRKEIQCRYTGRYCNYQKQPPGCSVRKGVLRNLQNSQENTCAGLIPATLFKKRLWLRCFLVKFAKFLRTPFLQNISGRVLLNCWLWLCQFVKSVKKRMLSIEEYWFMDKLFLLV